MLLEPRGAASVLGPLSWQHGGGGLGGLRAARGGQKR